MKQHLRRRSTTPSCSSIAVVAACLLAVANVAGCAEPSTSRSQAERASQTSPEAPPSKPAEVSAAATKKGFIGDIEELTTGNSNFRQVLYTGEHLQLVLMSLRPGEEIGEEVHSEIDQFIRVEQGRGQAIIDSVRHEIEDDSAVVVPAGARHNVVNTGAEPLKLYTVYGPPEHRDGVVRASKAEAVATDDHFDGKTTE